MPIILPGTPVGRTYLELQNDALHDDFSPAKYRTIAKRLLNEAQHRIFRTTRLSEGDQSDSFYLLAGTATYALPSNSVRIDSIRDAVTGLSVEPVSVDQLDALPPTATGSPRYFAQVGGQVTFYPTPNTTGTLEMRFRFNPVDMTSDGDYPTVPADYQHLLVTYTRSRLFRLEDDPQMAAEWQATWLSDLGELRADLQRRSRRVRQIPGMWDRPARPTFVRP